MRWFNPIPAHEYITRVLGLEIERPRQSHSKAAAMKIYPNGRITIVVPAGMKLEAPDVQRTLWHEVGHYLDRSRAFGGRGKHSATAIATTGDISTPNLDALRRHREYLQRNRRRLEYRIRFDYKGRIHRSLESLCADPEVTPDYKWKCTMLMKRNQEQEKAYLEQGIEIFADGFAEYVLDPVGMKKAVPEVARIYEGLIKDRPELKA